MSTSQCCFISLGAVVGLAVTLHGNEAFDVRAFSVEGTTLCARVWQEADAVGGRTSWWSAAPDGVNFSPPRLATYELLLRYARFDPLVGQPAVPGLLAASSDTHVYLVQYYTQPFDEYRAALRELGCRVTQYVPQDADAVVMPAGVAQSVAALPFVRAVRPYHPAYRLAPELLKRLGVSDSVVRCSIETLERGTEAQERLAAVVQAFGGTVHVLTPDGFRMEATLDFTALLAAARADECNFVELADNSAGFDSQMRGPAGMNADAIEPFGFTGQGVRGEVLDVGLRDTHVAFQHPHVLFHGGNGSNLHGTATYGIVFGDGTSAPQGDWRGLLPTPEQGIFGAYTQLSWFGGSQTPGQHLAELIDPNGPYRGVFFTSAVGSPQTTTYTTISAEYDDALFLNDVLACQSMSNTGNQQSRPQAWAKNVVAVGGIVTYGNDDRGDDGWGGQSSIGPAADGRIKPDCAGIFDYMGYLPDPNCDTCYSVQTGTSSAVSMVAGAFGLLFQMWHEGVWVGHGGGASVFADRCHAATARALMFNSGYLYKCSAADPGQPGTPPFTSITRYVQGWGMPNLGYLHDQAAKTFVVDQTDVVRPTQYRDYIFLLPAGEPAFKATLVYRDPKGNPAVQGQHRVNDLDLHVRRWSDPNEYSGNSGMLDSSWTAPNGARDTKNTIENVFVPNPPPGVWHVTVLGTEIVQDGHPETPELDADFALVVYGGRPVRKGDLNCDGRVNFDDINPFVLALSDPQAYYYMEPQCDIQLADVNGDGRVDFDDINPFVALLSNP